MTTKKQLAALILVCAVLIVGAGTYAQSTYISIKSEKAQGQVQETVKAAALDKLAKVEASAEQEKTLGTYVLFMMDQVRADLTDSKKQLLARSIVKTANDMFTDESHKKAFVGMIAIESRFKRDAKSPTGAVGLTQIIPNYANDHGGPCGIDSVKVEDLYDSEMNLAVGACYFRFLLERYHGDVPVALAAYNAGHNSKTAEVYSRSGDMSNEETLKYIAKFVFLMNQDPAAKPVKATEVAGKSK